MKWIADKLSGGETVQIKLSGNSMTPRIKSRQLVIIEPCKIADVKQDDVVFCKVKGNYYLHLVKKVGDDGRILIGNNHGRINGWTKLVFGKLKE